MPDMVANPETYFRQMMPARSALLKTLEEQARREKIPIVGPLVGELLYILVRTARAERVLELGTATGYSAIFLAEACAATAGKVTTLEWNENLVRQARANLEAAGLSAWAEVKRTDALDEIARLTDTFDLVFLDIEKEDYLQALPHCTRIVRPGGILLADNVAFADAVPFNRALQEDPAWRNVNLYAFMPEHSPEHDGLGLAVKMG